jgi:hypothetical protein
MNGTKFWPERLLYADTSLQNLYKLAVSKHHTHHS